MQVKPKEVSIGDRVWYKPGRLPWEKGSETVEGTVIRICPRYLLAVSSRGVVRSIPQPILGNETLKILKAREPPGQAADPVAKKTKEESTWEKMRN